jgi:hypothetical protein
MTTLDDSLDGTYVTLPGGGPSITQTVPGSSSNHSTSLPYPDPAYDSAYCGFGSNHASFAIAPVEQPEYPGPPGSVTPELKLYQQMTPPTNGSYRTNLTSDPMTPLSSASLPYDEDVFVKPGPTDLIRSAQPLLIPQRSYVSAHIAHQAYAFAGYPSFTGFGPELGSSRPFVLSTLPAETSGILHQSHSLHHGNGSLVARRLSTQSYNLSPFQTPLSGEDCTPPNRQTQFNPVDERYILRSQQATSPDLETATSGSRKKVRPMGTKCRHPEPAEASGVAFPYRVTKPRKSGSIKSSRPAKSVKSSGQPTQSFTRTSEGIPNSLASAHSHSTSPYTETSSSTDGTPEPAPPPVPQEDLSFSQLAVQIGDFCQGVDSLALIEDSFPEGHPWILKSNWILTESKEHQTRRRDIDLFRVTLNTLWKDAAFGKTVKENVLAVIARYSESFASLEWRVKPIKVAMDFEYNNEDAQRYTKILKEKSGLQADRSEKLAILFGLMFKFVTTMPPQTFLTSSPDWQPLLVAADTMGRMLEDIEKLQRWKYEDLAEARATMPGFYDADDLEAEG